MLLRIAGKPALANVYFAAGIPEQASNKLGSNFMSHSGRLSHQFGSSLKAILGLSALLIWFTVTPASGINIIPIFDAGQSDSPSFDPSGAGLSDLFDYVELYYQDIFEDSHTLTINFWYDDLSDANGTLGSHSLVSQSGGRETVANIRFDTQSFGSERNWFIDSTPETDFEYSMGQTLWRDLSQAEQDDYYNHGGGADSGNL